MSELIFIRHAETDLAGTFCGHTDPPVNARGEAQIQELIAQLGVDPFDAIYSSDLRRAMHTAASLAQAFAVPCTPSRNLREIYFGRWEALTWNRIESKDAGYAKRWLDSFPTLPAPEGEAFPAFKGRVLQEVDRLLSLAPDKRLAVITHGGVMRIVLQVLLRQTEKQAWQLTQSYCSFFVYAAKNALQKASQ